MLGLGLNIFTLAIRRYFGGGGGQFAGSSLNLDFTSGNQSLDPRITFTRASTGTRINASGVLVSEAIDGPRFDYDPVTLQPKGLLIEEQRTNLLTYSSEFDNAVWNKGISTSVSANAIAAPDESLTADTFTITSGADNGVYQSVAVVPGTTYTQSWYVKLGTLSASVYRFALFNNTASSFIAQDIVPTQTPTSAEWTRITYTFTVPAGCTSVRIYPNRSPSATSGTYSLWGAQLEVGAFPTSYIPTTTAAATRAADVAVMTGANFSNWYRQDEGTLFADASSYAAGGATQRRLLVIDDGGTSNRITLRYEPLMANAGFTSSVAGALVANIQSGAALLANVPYKNAGTYKTDDYAFALGGSLIGADTSGAVPVVNAARLGQGSTGEHINGHIRKIAYFPRRMTNSELQGLTS